MNLPVAFLERMKKLLQAEYDDFMESYNAPRYYGLRINTLKIDVTEFLSQSPFKLEPVPWVKEGFYFSDEDRPGKHPYYHAGLYYIQEPSAMTPGALIGVEPGDKVLDLCAAPGGKSTQVASYLQGQGVLVSNDISFDRVKPLCKNIDLSGITNSIITNEDPKNLAKVFVEYFDKILVDAPCSGEGMFRKDPDAAKSWDKFSVEVCVGMQKDILEQAARMLKVGGRILYSTCTFAPEENEGMITQFLHKHPEFKLVKLPEYVGFSHGQPKWVEGGAEDLKYTIRLWPHKLKGEGHFLALLEKTEVGLISEIEKLKPKKKLMLNEVNSKDLEYFKQFCQESINRPMNEKIVQIGERIYLQPHQLPDLNGLNVIRPGWYLGDLKKKRFEPSQGLAMGLQLNNAKNYINFDLNDTNLFKYLRGETLNIATDKGWVLVGVNGHPLGWAKQAGGILKNYYPKAWRQLS